MSSRSLTWQPVLLERVAESMSTTARRALINETRDRHYATLSPDLATAGKKRPHRKGEGFAFAHSSSRKAAVPFSNCRT